MHRKAVRLAAGLCAASLLLAGCSFSTGGSGAEKIRLMVWSPLPLMAQSSIRTER